MLQFLHMLYTQIKLTGGNEMYIHCIAIFEQKDPKETIYAKENKKKKKYRN